MQRIHYSGASLLTGDEIAQGIVTYAHALVRSENRPKCIYRFVWLTGARLTRCC